jgi:hypothetical protein
MGQRKGESRYSIREQVPGQGVLDFLRNAGSYRRVRTQKVDFLTFEDFDYSRTRLKDEEWGYEWDRAIIYLKNPEMFIIFDVFKARREEWFTLANLWHAQRILAHGEHWYKTVYEKIQDKNLSTDRHLLILFPLTHYRLEGSEPIRRHYQDEFLIYQTTAQHFELGQTAGFVTVLIPHSKDSSYLEWPAQVRTLPIVPEQAGLGVEIEAGDRTVVVGIKNDLRRDIARDWRRPRYTYEAGRIGFGEFETDGDLVVAAVPMVGGKPSGKRLSYTIVNLTKGVFRDRVLIEAKPSLFGLAFDGRADGPGLGKLRYWRDDIEVKETP